MVDWAPRGHPVQRKVHCLSEETEWADLFLVSGLAQQQWFPVFALTVPLTQTWETPGVFQPCERRDIVINALKDCNVINGS